MKSLNQIINLAVLSLIPTFCNAAEYKSIYSTPEFKLGTLHSSNVGVTYANKVKIEAFQKPFSKLFDSEQAFLEVFRDSLINHILTVIPKTQKFPKAPFSGTQTDRNNEDFDFIIIIKEAKFGEKFISFHGQGVRHNCLLTASIETWRCKNNEKVHEFTVETSGGVNLFMKTNAIKSAISSNSRAIAKYLKKDGDKYFRKDASAFKEKYDKYYEKPFHMGMDVGFGFAYQLAGVSLKAEYNIKKIGISPYLTWGVFSFIGAGYIPSVGANIYFPGNKFRFYAGGNFLKSISNKYLLYTNMEAGLFHDVGYPGRVVIKYSLGYTFIKTYSDEDLKYTPETYILPNISFIFPFN